MRRATITIAVTALALGGLGGCIRPSTPKPGSISTPSATATTGATPSSSTSVNTSTWSSGPRTVNRTVSGAVPELIAIRPATHTPEGFDRIVFDFRSALPGYDMRYVSTPILGDPSGLTIVVPGRQHLQIKFKPAQAHSATTGTPTVTLRSATLNYPMLTSYAITGDFEADLTIVLGLDDVVGYQVGELPGQPGRIYVDLAA